jgi:hypothetical protein
MHNLRNVWENVDEDNLTCATACTYQRITIYLGSSNQRHCRCSGPVPLKMCLPAPHHTSARWVAWNCFRLLSQQWSALLSAYCTRTYLLSQGWLQGCAACAAAQGAERVRVPIHNHKFENTHALYGCRLEHNRKESEWKANQKHRNLVRERAILFSFTLCFGWFRRMLGLDSPLRQMGKTTGPTRIFHRRGLFRR